MKKSVSAILALGVCIVISAFTFKLDSVIKAKNIQKDFVQVSNNLFLDKYEVSNADYRKFMGYLKENKQDGLYAEYVSDSAQWAQNFDHEPLKAYYNSHSSYDNYPAVAVTYEAATAYCIWLTAQYNADPKRDYKNVVFRLPTEQEWTDAASRGDKNKMYPWDNYYLRNKEGKFLCNYRHLGDESITFDAKTKSYKVLETFAGRPVLISPTTSFYPTPLGLYNVSGNAAEMVSEKGLAKGGSFNDPGSDVKIASKKYYDGSSPEVGFRVLMEILEQ